MAEYLIQDTTLTAIADQVRTLNDATGNLSPAQMKTNLQSANELVVDQANLIEQIKAALDGKASGGGGEVATGNTRAEYIKFTGSQIIDTGIICTQDTKIKLSFTRDSSNTMYLYGVTSSGNTASVTAYLTSGNGAWRFGSKYANRSITTNEELIQTTIVTKTGVTALAASATYSGVTNFETIGSLLLGAARNSDGTVGAAQFIGKIMSFEMWQGAELVLQLIPAIDANGVYGFWDGVSKKMFYSITDTSLEGSCWAEIM